MTPGNATLNSTLLGAFLFGLSRDHLWFEKDRSPDKQEMVMKSKSRRAAQRCPECGTLVIPGRED